MLTKSALLGALIAAVLIGIWAVLGRLDGERLTFSILFGAANFIRMRRR